MQHLSANNRANTGSSGALPTVALGSLTSPNGSATALAHLDERLMSGGDAALSTGLVYRQWHANVSVLFAGALSWQGMRCACSRQACR